MTYKRVITLQDARKPSSSSLIMSWIPGGPTKLTPTTRTHITGGYTSTNGCPSGENFNPGTVGGNIYTGSGGFYASVSTKSSDPFYTQHYIGPTQGLTSGGVVNGSDFVGKLIFSTTASNWGKRVIGFYCQVSSLHEGGSGSEIDGCGVCNTFRISGVYVDKNGRVRIVDMCAGGNKLTGHTWNTQADSNKWVDMSYYTSYKDTILNNDFALMGWVVGMTHQKVCGNKTKNCTGRIRYLAPLVSSYDNGGLYAGPPDIYQVWPPEEGYLSALNSPSNQYGVGTI